MSNQRTSNILKTINHFFGIFLCIWFLTPYLNRNGYAPLMYLATGGWVSSSLFTKTKSVSNYVLKLALVWLCLITLYKYIGKSSCAVGNIYIQYYYWFFLYMYYYYQNNDEPFLEKIPYYILVIVLANIINNISLIIENPGISEDINAVWGSKYLKTNAGATSFSFECVLYIIGCVLLLKKRENMIPKFVLYGCIVLAFIYIYMAGRGTAFLTLIIFGILHIMRKMFGASKSTYIFGCFITFLMAFIFFPVLAESLLEKFPDSRTFMRLNELAQLLRGNESVSGSGSSRIELSKLSMNTWFESIESIMIGIGDHRSETNVSGNFTIGIGNHAEFFDVFARYGLVGAFLFFTAFVKSINIEKGKSYKIMWLTFFIPLMIYGFINNITKYASMGILIYLFCLNIIDSDKCNIKEEYL